MSIFFQPNGQLTPLGRKVTGYLAGAYALAISFMCFLPQHFLPNPKGFSTPGIVQVGRFYFLPTPFNSLVNGHEVHSLKGIFYIFLQNISNVFLLFPLVLALIFLFKKWQSTKTVVLYSFCISLGIECTQLLLDGLMDAGRVFEIDDLWTNTLGGLLAYLFYQQIQKIIKKT
ncbi:VanZ family protein [Streptococcus gallinaceus]|uniref:Glycopeptide antibiotics resistance protein n=1 Tax=Streptococcus gallinaceus TaxID=165758 RepID=A0ABV2JJU5_9STRE|nr:VanZ family protein [Streptococcus gallinaceus]MCP1638834.1 glycopeptide antibiotics resistance protein [Streptococcus gallinaceus]MCP1769922.1 glycopeptide antibiotics resistance protein [Streptococcus gallinaceus]